MEFISFQKYRLYGRKLYLRILLIVVYRLPFRQRITCKVLRNQSGKAIRYIKLHTIQTMYIHTYIYIQRVSQEEGTKLRESVPYVKIYRYNPKHLYPNLNGYGDNGQRKVWSSCTSTHCTSSADSVHVCPRLLCQITEIPLTLQQ